MKPLDHAALIYLGSALGAAGLSYYKGERDFRQIGKDALIHGGVLGTGLNVVLWLADNHGPAQGALQTIAVPNVGDQRSLGSLAKDAVEILQKINPDVLYKAAQLGGGVFVAPEADDPYRINLPQK
jgi:hypothetical protein